MYVMKTLLIALICLLPMVCFGKEKADTASCCCSKQESCEKKPKVAPYNGQLITHETIVKNGYRDLYEALRGTVAGAVVNDGKIYLRNIGYTKEPLFIVDGVECNSSALANSRIDMSRIDTIEVVKDGSMFGLKGDAGLVVITTLK